MHCNLSKLKFCGRSLLYFLDIFRSEEQLCFSEKKEKTFVVVLIGENMPFLSVKLVIHRTFPEYTFTTPFALTRISKAYALT
jgi:hypothetical protein